MASRPRCLRPALLGLAILVPAAFASGPPAQSGSTLSPIVVDGDSISIPMALQMIKAALARPWSTAPADRYAIVCRILHTESLTSGVLHCETNARHFGINAGMAGNGAAARTFTNAGAALQLGQWVNDHVTNPGELRSLLKRLPPPGSSYTLRLAGHGGNAVDYVIAHGQVVAEYTVHDGKRTLVWSRAPAKPTH